MKSSASYLSDVGKSNPMTRQSAAKRYCHECGVEIPKGSTYCRICEKEKPK